jgi:hypothetical protein
MVDEDMNHISQKIVSTCPQSKDNSNQLKIMRGIVLFMTVQLSWGIHNHTTVLYKNTTKSSARCITIDIKGFYDVWLFKHRRCSRQLLQSLECFITLCILDILLLFLQKNNNRFGNVREVMDECAIVASQSEKTVNLMHSSLRLPI